MPFTSDDPSRARQRRLIATLPSLTLPALLIATLTAGCHRPATTPAKTGATTTASAVDFDALRDGIRQASGDPSLLAPALQRLNESLAADPGRRPEPLAAAELAALKATFHLSDTDLAELNRVEFTGLDAAELHQDFFFHDVARTLEVKAKPPVERAHAAVEWLVRHVRLQNPITFTQQSADGRTLIGVAPPDPPVFVIQRGSGTPAERLGVLLKLLHHLDIDAWAVGDEEAASDANRIWAVAVPTPSGLYLFDHRLGLAVPGETLEILTKDAAPLKKLTVDAKLIYDVTPERVKASRCFLGTSLWSMSPRAKALQSLLGEYSPRLATDPSKLREAGGKLKLAGWRPDAPGSPLHLLADFLPVEDGGRDRSPRGSRRTDLYQVGLVPWEGLGPKLAEVPGFFGNLIQQTYHQITTITQRPGQAALIRERKQFVDAIRAEFREVSDPNRREALMRLEMQRNPFNVSTEGGPSIREQLLRGSYNDATQALIMIGDQFRPLRRKTDRTALDKAVNEWLARVPAVHAEFLRAQRSNDPEQKKQVDVKMNELRHDLGPVNEMVTWLAAGAVIDEADRLIAIAKQDQAEARVNAGAQDPQAAWRSAAQTWAIYLGNHGDSPYAGPARRLYARALAHSGQPAAGQFRQAAESGTVWDRIASAYLATQQP